MITSCWEKVIAEARLISLPEAFFQLKDVLDNPDYSMADVAIAISYDPALTARLLRLINSPFYGFSGKIDTVFRAVSMIGSKQVYDLAIATAVTQTFANMDCRIINMTDFWRRSVCCGLIARQLAKACAFLDDERLFVAGLLHDIGHLVMYQTIPELSQQAMIKASQSGQALHLIEKEMTGLDYARVGGELMRQWHLPECLRETTALHSEPEKALIFPLETFLVHIAVNLTRATGSAVDAHNMRLVLDSGALKMTGLTLEACLEAGQRAEQEVSKVFANMFPLKSTA